MSQIIAGKIISVSTYKSTYKSGYKVGKTVERTTLSLQVNKSKTSSVEALLNGEEYHVIKFSVTEEDEFFDELSSFHCGEFVVMRCSNVRNANGYWNFNITAITPPSSKELYMAPHEEEYCAVKTNGTM